MRTFLFLFFITALPVNNFVYGEVVKATSDTGKLTSTVAAGNEVAGLATVSSFCGKPGGTLICTTGVSLLMEVLKSGGQKDKAKDLKKLCKKIGSSKLCDNPSGSNPNANPAAPAPGQQELENALFCMRIENAQHPDCKKDSPSAPPLAEVNCRTNRDHPDCEERRVFTRTPSGRRALSFDCDGSPCSPEEAVSRCEKNPSACAEKAVEALRNSGIKFDGQAVVLPDGKKVNPPFGPEQFEQAGFDSQLVSDSFKAMGDFSKKMEKRFKARLKNLNTPVVFPKDNDEIIEDEEPTLTSGAGGRSRSSRKKNSNTGQIDYFKHLQEGIKADRSIQNFKPKQLGGSKVGTSYDDIFQMVSKSYRERQ